MLAVDPSRHRRVLMRRFLANRFRQPQFRFFAILGPAVQRERQQARRRSRDRIRNSAVLENLADRPRRDFAAAVVVGAEFAMYRLWIGGMRLEDSRQLRLREHQVPRKRNAWRRGVDAQFLRSPRLFRISPNDSTIDDCVRIFEPAHRARDVWILLARRRHDEPLNPGALAIISSAALTADGRRPHYPRGQEQRLEQFQSRMSHYNPVSQRFWDRAKVT